MFSFVLSFPQRGTKISFFTELYVEIFQFGRIPIRGNLIGKLNFSHYSCGRECWLSGSSLRTPGVLMLNTRFGGGVGRHTRSENAESLDVVLVSDQASVMTSVA